MEKQNRTIGFIGVGNMGSTLIRSMLANGNYKAADFSVSDPRREALENLAQEFPGIRTSQSNDETAQSGILVLAVKPQIYRKVVTELAPRIDQDTLLVTIAAGITLQSVSEWAGGVNRIIRTMPNTPALVSEGMTAICPGPNVHDEELTAVRNMFDSVGKTVIMPEELMDAYTALAGSSPAWVFMFIEALADAAVKEGIPRVQAYKIAAQAVLGSAKLVLGSNEHPAELKDRVCSPGGTTIAGVAALEKAAFRSAVMQAVEVCAGKGRELSSK